MSPKEFEKKNIRDFLWRLSLILCTAEHYSNTRDPYPPLLFPWEMNNNLSGGQTKRGLWLQGDRLSFPSFVFHLPVKLARMAYLKWESGKVVLFSRGSLLSLGVWTQWRWGWRGREIPEAAVCTGDEWWSIKTRKYPSTPTMEPYYIYHAPACPSTWNNWIRGHRVLESVFYVNPLYISVLRIHRVVLKAKS